ncbi:DUF4240 domain-containing protein [Streptacidiphilus sp. PB12-B1b]|uniref:DUF4240 domain-containing protein n=1 Tax=Streptacidiphilus sp. PB12-B1b TaxID=2705012 RepID=UPI001CDBF1FE|nr:DUF4240 domain-containing protein [Streptacidiphilus sp. PB12-B1b]
MTVEAFWELMEACRRQAQGRQARLAWLQADLSRRPLPEIIGFQLCLEQLAAQALTGELAAAARRIFGGRCTDDDLEYFGLWLIGLGPDAYRRALLDPDTLADAPEVLALAGRHWTTWGEDWPGWETLDYAASEAYELATGDQDDFHDALEAHRDTHPAAAGPTIEPQTAHDHPEAARRLLKLSTLFPLTPAP